MSIFRLKLLFAALAIIAMCLAAGVLWWAIHPSEIYLRPVSAMVRQEQDGSWTVTSTRELPHGDQLADWSTEIIVLRPDTSFACRREGRTRYRADAGPVVKYRLEGWAMDCMNAGPPVSITFNRQVLLWGWLPLRPVSLSIDIKAEDLPIRPSDE